jgi:hypothetical protein
MPMSDEERASYEKAVKDWLAKGNKITVCEPYARTEDIGYMNRWKGPKKKKKVDKSE